MFQPFLRFWIDKAKGGNRKTWIQLVSTLLEILVDRQRRSDAEADRELVSTLLEILEAGGHN